MGAVGFRTISTLVEVPLDILCFYRWPSLVFICQLIIQRGLPWKTNPVKRMSVVMNQKSLLRSVVYGCLLVSAASTVAASRGDQPERVGYVLPRHKRGDWVGPGHARKSTRPATSGVVELNPFAFLDRLAAHGESHHLDARGSAVSCPTSGCI